MTEVSKTPWAEFFKKPVNLLVIGLFLGAFTILSMRVVLIRDHATHYHANFALYINGQKDEFSNFTFYEEVQGCSVDMHDSPKHRAHMHNNENHIVHVHADGVTWGHFFANLGYGLTNKSVKTDDGVLVDGTDGKKLTFFLNRVPVESIANRVIESEDVLLIDYGDGSSIDQRYEDIKKDAAGRNTQPDPAMCAGSQPLTFGERLKRAFDFTK